MGIERVSRIMILLLLFEAASGGLYLLVARARVKSSPKVVAMQRGWASRMTRRLCQKVIAKKVAMCGM